MKRCYLVLLVLLVIGMSAKANIVVNGDFETLYKPGTAITGIVAGNGWTQGVGPDCPIDNQHYEFSDATTGDVADIPGWIGYDRDGWIAFGGTYGRDETTGNLQGSVSKQHNHTEGGLHAYISNGGGWGNKAGGLITSAAPLAGLIYDDPYVLSMYAKGGAGPKTLVLLADGEVVVPDAAGLGAPDLDGWMEVTRTYDELPGGDLTIVLGVSRPLSPDVPGATGAQAQFDDVSFIPEPATVLLLGLGGLALVRRKRR